MVEQHSRAYGHLRSITCPSKSRRAVEEERPKGPRECGTNCRRYLRRLLPGLVQTSEGTRERGPGRLRKPGKHTPAPTAIPTKERTMLQVWKRRTLCLGLSF